jgi:hypothetical protein
VSSLEQASPAVAETEIGIGGTMAWKLCSIDERTSVAVYYEVRHTCVALVSHLCSIDASCGGTLPPAAQRGDSPLTTHPWVIFFFSIDERTSVAVYFN